MENTHTQLRRFVRYPWIFSLVGVLLIGLGVWVLTRNDADFAGLTTLFVFWFVGIGALEIFFALSNRGAIPSWGGMLAFGVMEVLLGLMLVAEPPNAVYVFSVYIGVWLLMRGMLLVLGALDLDMLGFSPDWMWVLIGGVLTTGLGIGVFLQSRVGFGTAVVWTGLAMIWAGAFYILFAFKLKKPGRGSEQSPTSRET